MPASRRRPGRRAAWGPLAAVALLCAAPAAHAGKNVWPEINAFVPLGERTRLFALWSRDRDFDAGRATEATWGLHADWLPPPERTGGWNLLLRAGYNRIDAFDPGGADENRLLVEVTVRALPLPAGWQFANRNRLEWRDVGDEQTVRWRNRSRVDRGFAPAGLLGADWGARLAAGGMTSITPYAMFELFEDSDLSRFDRWLLQVGVEAEWRGGYGAEVYLAHRQDVGGAGRNVTAVGAVLVLRW